jgi:ketosteroid isomerase-like protein
MNHAQFQDWLDRYVEAWKTYDADKVGALFSADAEYRYHPQDEPLRGRDAIVKSWLDGRDEPGTYDAEYHPLAIDPDGTHVANGWSRYFEAPGGEMRDEYCNAYVCRFNGAGECSSFTEYWIQNSLMRRRAIDELLRKAREEAAAADEAGAADEAAA